MLRCGRTHVYFDVAHRVISGKPLLAQHAERKRGSFKERFGGYRYLVASAARIGYCNLALTYGHKDRLTFSPFVRANGSYSPDHRLYT